MIGVWLNFPAWGVFFALVGLFGGFSACLHLVTFRVVGRERMLRYNGLVAPFFTSFAVLFALLAGFVANDVWDRNKQAARAILSERDGLLNVYYLSVASVSDMAAIRMAERDYIEIVVRDEWPRMVDQQRSTAAGMALGALLSHVAEPRIAGEAGISIQDALLQSVLKVRSARYDRIAISGDHSDELKWASVLLLALLTQAALALEHLERDRVQLTALLLFGLGATVALGPVALRERPFSGAHPISSTPLYDVLTIMANPASHPQARSG